MFVYNLDSHINNLRKKKERIPSDSFLVSFHYDRSCRKTKICSLWEDCRKTI